MGEYERWESRYSTSEYVFGEAPNAFLESCRNLLPKTGKALSVADGEGRNGVFLAECGLEVTSLDFSPAAQKKAADLARRRGVDMAIVLGDVHEWTWPTAAFDVVVEIFTQFSDPSARKLKWAGMRRALRRGGLLLIEGYTPKQLDYGTGGPKELDHLYTRDMLKAEFGDFSELELREYEPTLSEGGAHAGKCAVIDLIARK